MVLYRTHKDIRSLFISVAGPACHTPYASLDIEALVDIFAVGCCPLATSLCVNQMYCSSALFAQSMLDFPLSQRFTRRSICYLPEVAIVYFAL